MSEPEPWVTVEEVSKHVGIAKDTVYRWIDSKNLLAHKIGRLWKFKLTQIDKWIENGGASSTHSAKTKK